MSTDLFTRWARPGVVWSGVVIILVNYGLLPLLSFLFDRLWIPIAIPLEVWGAWGAVTTAWTVGRTVEKTKNGGDAGLNLPVVPVEGK